MLRRGALRLWLRRTDADALRPADLWSIEHHFQDPTAGFRGRGLTAVVALEDGRRIVVRPYRHGGLLRGLTGDRYSGPGRLEAELDVLAKLEHAGLAVPHGVGGRARRRGPGMWQLHLFTWLIPNARDLREILLDQETRHQRHESRWRRTVQALGEVVRGVHEQDVHHTDLHVKNLMVDADGRPWVIDFDKAQLGLLEAQRFTSLAKLYRSGTKLPPGARPSRTELARFARGYFGADWRAGWRSVQKRYQRGLPMHRIGWWIDRLYRR